MDRFVVVWCASLLNEGERGDEPRAFLDVMAAVERFCPWVSPVRLGICTVPARGPSRFFGGEARLAEQLAAALAEVPRAGEVHVGIADGLFAGILAARTSLIVSKGATAEFLAPWSVSVLRRPDLGVTLQRLGIHTLGQFAALPARHVFGRFGSDAVTCHRVARGGEGELGGVRDPGLARRLGLLGEGPSEALPQPGFFGGASAADTRAAASLTRLQRRLGTDAVVIGRVRGGRGPAERATLVPWGSKEADRSDAARTAPWPGQLPPPSPAVVLTDPLAAEVRDAAGRAGSVTGRGLLSGAPDQLSIEGGPWQQVVAWAGPWPANERWWSALRRRARLQVVTDTGAAVLLAAERERWWVEAVYD